VETLEKDDAFRKKLETADEADIRVGIFIIFILMLIMKYGENLRVFEYLSYN